jgi:hypothetical protein
MLLPFAHDKTVAVVLIMVWLVSVNTVSDLVVITCLTSVFSGWKHRPDGLCAMVHSQILSEFCCLGTKSLVMRKHYSPFSEERIQDVSEEDTDENIWACDRGSFDRTSRSVECLTYEMDNRRVACYIPGRSSKCIFLSRSSDRPWSRLNLLM